MFENLSKKTIQVLNLFLDNADSEFYLREIARRLDISPSTAKIALDTLEKEGLIKKKERANASFYRLNTDNQRCAELKKTKNLDFILKSGMIKKIEQENPTIISITLFGSYAKGTNTSQSDIDLLIISQKKTNYTITNIEGTELNIIQYTPAGWRKKALQDKPFYKEIIRTGKALKGMLPEI